MSRVAQYRNRLRSPVLRGLSACLIAVIPVLCTVGSASGASSRVALVVEGGGDCALEPLIAARLDKLLGDLGPGEVTNARFYGTQTEGGTAGVLVTQTSSYSGDRYFEPLPCDELAHAVAIVIALAVEPTLSLEQLEGDPLPAPPVTPPPPQEAPKPETRQPTSPAKKRDTAFESQLRAAIRQDTRLGWIPGLDAALGVTSERWSLLLNAQWWKARPIDYFPVAGGALTIGRTEFGVLGCHLWAASSFRLGPCSALRAVAWTAETTGISNPKKATQWRLRGELGFEAHWSFLPHGRLIAGAHAGIGGSEHFVSATLGQLYKSEAVEFWPSLGLGLSL